MILVRYVLLLVVLFFAQVTAKAAFIDSVAYYKKQLYISTTPVDLKIKTYYNLYDYYGTTNPQLAQAYFKRGYFLTQKYHSIYGKGWFHKINAYNELTAGRLQSGIVQSQLAASYFKALKDTINFVESNYFGAYGLQLIAKRDEARQLLLSSLKMLPSNRFYKQQGMLYSSLSYLENDHDLVQSLDYLMKSKAACLKANNVIGLYSIYTDLALFYTNMNDFHLALYNSKLALYWVKKNKPVVINDIATVNSNIANALLHLKKHKLALYYVTKSLEAANKIGSNVFLIKGLIDQTQIFIALNQYKRAEKTLQDIKNLHLDASSLFSYHFLWIKFHSVQQQFEKTKLHIQTCDSLLATGLSLTKSAQLNYYDLLQSYYKQTGEKEKQVVALNSYYQLKIAQLEQQKDFRLIKLQLKSIQIEKQYVQRALRQQRLKTIAITRSKHNERKYFIISVLFLIVILFYISWSIYWYRKRNKQLRDFNGILEELVLEKEVLLREIHHRVKNNFQIINSILSIQSRQKDLSIKSFLAQFSTRIYSMAFVHEKLYGNKVVGQHNAVTFLRELLEHSCVTFPDQTLKIDLVVTGKAIYLPIEQLLPIGLIVNELTVNSLKYAFPMQENGMIAIAIDQNEHQVLLSFQDNGIGKIDPTMKNTGLIVVDAFVTKLRGTVIVNHENGLHYQFAFPKQVDQK